MTPEADAWLDALAARLPRHARILRALVDAAERDGRIRTVMVGCSVGRGVADELSDIDAHMSVVENAWPEIVDDVERIARAAGDAIEMLVHRLVGVAPDTHRHVFVQYRDGVQLSLVVQPVSAQTRRGRAPDVVALHDPDDRLGVVVEPSDARATADELREWSVLGWAALDDVVKYLRRGSLWEAIDRLNAARTEVWRLWAAAEGATSPVHGLTALLDASAMPLPPGIEDTVARLAKDDIARAARACATQLSRVATSRGELSTFVTDKLDALMVEIA